MTRKPDWWERMAVKQLSRYCGIASIRHLLERDMARLLRREHQAVMRVVRDLKKLGYCAHSDDPNFIAGYEQACNDILTALAKRAR